MAEVDDGLQGLRKAAKRAAFGIVPNRAHQGARGFMQAANYKLGIVEFDDQGRCYHRSQLDRLSDVIEGMRENSEDAIFIVFVHGWKHDARSDDENLTAFRKLLDKTAVHERGNAAGARPRDVYGIFVGWRGMSLFGFGLLEDVTFWDRQEAGHRVATGSVRELFGRLRHYRNSRLKRGGSPLLMISGHSFGGMIVFSALAQSLIEAASAPAGRVIPGFADLVLLINPAIEGARYLPIYDLVRSAPFQTREIEQLPVFICVQARNDSAVGAWFPIGNILAGMKQKSVGPLEKRCVNHGLGFIDRFHTHRLEGPTAKEPFVLAPPESARTNPYWIVSASKDVVNKHGGIWLEPFMRFVLSMLFQHVRQSMAEPAAVPPAAAPEMPLAAAVARKAATPPPSVTANLADFAKTISWD